MTSANSGPGDNLDRSGIQVISRAASILRALDEERDGLSLAELASRLGLARSTVQRIVKALSDEQLLTPTSRHSRVKLGPLLMRLGASAKSGVVEMVRPFMQRLSKELGETVDLSVLQGTTALFVDQVAGSHRLSAVSGPGQVFPLYSTANGKALLASLDERSWKPLLPKALEAHTDATITTMAALEKEIAKVRSTHLAFDRQEHTHGVSAIGTWFIDPTGRSYAISVPVPSVRFVDDDRLRNALRETREAILAVMGS